MTSSAVMAEASALRWVMSLAIKLGLMRIWLETDCLQIFQRWKRHLDEGSYLSSIIHDFFFLLCSSFDFVDLCFVRRSGNMVANVFARTTSSYAGLMKFKHLSKTKTLIFKIVLQ